MSIVNDIVSVEAFVKAKFPSATTFKQTAPLKPAANTFVVQLINDSRESETAYHFRNDREYRIVYFGTTAEDVLTKLDSLSTAFYQTLLIPIQGSLRYIRVEGVSISEPFKTENDMYAAIAILSSEVRQARTQAEYDKIMHVYVRYTV